MGGTLHPLERLSRTPTVGEYLKIRCYDGGEIRVQEGTLAYPMSHHLFYIRESRESQIAMFWEHVSGMDEISAVLHIEDKDGKALYENQPLEKKISAGTVSVDDIASIAKSTQKERDNRPRNAVRNAIDWAAALIVLYALAHNYIGFSVLNMKKMQSTSAGEYMEYVQGRIDGEEAPYKILNPAGKDTTYLLIPSDIMSEPIQTVWEDEHGKKWIRMKERGVLAPITLPNRIGKSAQDK